jgi:hypothetical protein
MGALNPLVAGVALKLEASKTAEIDSRAIERATRSAQPWEELFGRFFIALFELNQFSCFSSAFTGRSLEKSSELEEFRQPDRESEHAWGVLGEVLQ